MSDRKIVHQVDEVLPGGKLFLLGLQHVLVMYAGAVAVPLILGGVMKLPKEQVALLISADLFCCGIVTLIQSVGIWKFGILLAAISAVILNAYFNGMGTEKDARRSAAAATHGSEA
jgi:xanthine/uracil permease